MHQSNYVSAEVHVTKKRMSLTSSMWSWLSWWWWALRPKSDTLQASAPNPQATKPDHLGNSESFCGDEAFQLLQLSSPLLGGLAAPVLLALGRNGKSRKRPKISDFGPFGVRVYGVLGGFVSGVSGFRVLKPDTLRQFWRSWWLWSCC